MSEVRAFGAAGDGKADDTQAIRHALNDGNGVLEFSPGIYRITRTIEVDLTRPRFFGISGAMGATRILMEGPGPAFRLIGSHQGTANPTTILPPVWANERFPCIQGLEIVGAHDEADGIELIRTMQVTVQQVAIRNVGVGIRLSERNRNFLLSACHIFDNRLVGVLFDRCNLHQVIISANHISYNKRAGIQSIDGDLHNLQITGNDIEYNYGVEDELSAELLFDARDGIASEITIASNTIQAVPTAMGANVLVLGKPGVEPFAARLITITGNVLGSRQTNIRLSYADRVAVTGNTIYDGSTVSVDGDNSQHVVIGNNSFAWRSPAEDRMNGGIRLTQCVGCSLSGLVFDGSRRGSAESGGCIELVGCRDSAVRGCQILNPAYRGVWLDQCEYCVVSDNAILSRPPSGKMISAARADGKTNLVQHNMVTAGSISAFELPDAPEMSERNTIV